MTRRAVQAGCHIAIGGLAGLMLGALLHAQQQTVVKGFRVAEPYDPPYQNQTKYLLTGSEGRALGEGRVLLKDFRLETFARTGERQVIGSSPECVYDIVNRTVDSAGPMQLQTADGKFLIQGEGFLVRQTNLSFVISNKVDTTIHNDLLAAQTARTRSEGSTKTKLPVAPIANTNALLATNQIIKVFSDHAYFGSISNVAVYSSNVRVVDSQMDSTCEIMTLHRSTNGSLESIVAETNVIIIGRQDNSRATGEKAVYIVNLERETVELIGNAHWQDDQREAKADLFTFDRRDNTVRAEPNAYLRLPRAALDQSGPLSPKPTATTNATAKTNEYVEITSRLLLMQLPTTNRPGRVMIAQTNVLILSPADKSRATGDQAVYREADGTFLLSGKATWNSGQRLMNGDLLTLDRTHQVFTARSNAYLKLPLAALGQSTLFLSSDTNSTGHTARTNQFIEVFSDDCDYRDTLLNFRGNVRGSLLEGEDMNGWLTCGLLTVQVVSNQVKQVVARQKVAVGQVPPPVETARKVYKTLSCETTTVNFSTNGQPETFVAEEKVVIKQDEFRVGTNDIHTKLMADTVTGYFFAHTNQVERMVADGNVFLEQGERSANGGRAVYTATNNLVELTGQPTVKLPEGRITEAEALVWDRNNEKLSARGRFKSEWKRPVGGLNQTNLPFHK